ncbi:MAG: hypothetical protein H5U40_01490 [Polyangiaceae bacterium]|nr:hypothetical protein [Polyangiaceae bacterium]
MDSDVFEALANLRAATRVFVDDSARTLPEVRVHVVASNTSAVLLAQVLFGNAAKWVELVERNGIGNPLFITAGTSVEYLEA